MTCRKSPSKQTVANNDHGNLCCRFGNHPRSLGDGFIQDNYGNQKINVLVYVIYGDFSIWKQQIKEVKYPANEYYCSYSFCEDSSYCKNER
jgi:hypothetical protein